MKTMINWNGRQNKVIQQTNYGNFSFVLASFRRWRQLIDETNYEKIRNLYLTNGLAKNVFYSFEYIIYIGNNGSHGHLLL